MTLSVIPAKATSFGCTKGSYTVSEAGWLTEAETCEGVLDIDPSVIGIGVTAVANNSKITSVFIPSSVTRIEDSAFFNNDALTTVTFASGSKLTTIGANAFRADISLTSISLPDSVTEVGHAAFFNPSFLYPTQNLMLSAIELGSGLATIGDQAFLGARATSVKIPASVTSIQAQAFGYMPNLATFEIQAPSLLSVMDSVNDNGDIFDGSTALVDVQYCGYPVSIITNYVYPNSLHPSSVGCPAYAVTFDVDPLSVTPGSVDVNPGQSTVLPTLGARSGFIFAGWWSAKVAGSLVGLAGAEYTPTASSKVYARWTVKKTQTALKLPASIKKTSGKIALAAKSKQGVAITVKVTGKCSLTATRTKGLISAYTIKAAKAAGKCSVTISAPETAVYAALKASTKTVSIK